MREKATAVPDETERACIVAAVAELEKGAQIGWIFPGISEFHRRSREPYDPVRAILARVGA
jgi:hypothetical protein